MACSAVKFGCVIAQPAPTAARTHSRSLEGAKEVEDSLLIRRREPHEIRYDRIGFRRRIKPPFSVKTLLDRDKQVTCAAIMQEKHPLSHAPKAAREFVWPSRSLDDVVGEAASHVMHQRSENRLTGRASGRTALFITGAVCICGV